MHCVLRLMILADTITHTDDAHCRGLMIFTERSDNTRVFAESCFRVAVLALDQPKVTSIVTFMLRKCEGFVKVY